MTDLRKKLEAISEQPINGPGIHAMREFFAAVVEAIETHQAHCDLCPCQCHVCRADRNDRRHHG